MALNIEKKIRGDIPQVGVTPYSQIHAHSTGNANSTAQNEADYMYRKDLNTGFYTHVVGNGRIIQVAQNNRGAYDVGGGWNYETYAAVELIESHKSQAEFRKDYELYVNLLRQLAREAGLPTTLDTGSTGIISHNYATTHQPNNGSDHVDPYPYLAKWGISQAQFAKDLSTGFGTSSTTNLTQTETGEDDMNIFVFTATEDLSKVNKDFANYKKGATFLINANTGKIKYISDTSARDWLLKTRKHPEFKGGAADMNRCLTMYDLKF